MEFKLSKFTELTPDDLYNLLRLRSEIFVVEQNCIYQDLDDKDQQSYHLLVYKPLNNLIAYARIMDCNISYSNFCSIGRVLVKKENRKSNLGTLLMERSIKECENLFGQIPIKISAQFHLKFFYNRLGFKEEGEQYLEDDIPHISMIRLKIN